MCELLDTVRRWQVLHINTWESWIKGVQIALAKVALLDPYDPRNLGRVKTAK